VPEDDGAVCSGRNGSDREPLSGGHGRQVPLTDAVGVEHEALVRAVIAVVGHVEVVFPMLRRVAGDCLGEAVRGDALDGLVLVASQLHNVIDGPAL